MSENRVTIGRIRTEHDHSWVTYWRDDKYDGHPDKPHMAADSQDKTPQWSIYGLYDGRSYDPDCSCCWLNIPHTLAKHAKTIGKSIIALLPDELAKKIAYADSSDRTVERLFSGFYSHGQPATLEELEALSRDEIYRLVNRRYG